MAFEHYIRMDGRNLRLGFTTGTCAALAAAGAAEGLLTGQIPKTLSLITPKGIEVCVQPQNCWVFASDPEEKAARGRWSKAVCGVRKDAGDDVDVTDGLLILAEAERSCAGGSFRAGSQEEKPYSERVRILAGAGIGRVTKPGLDQSVGEAAINRVPREMIRREVLRVCGEQGYEGGITITISAPDGEKAARRTLNSRLGILGGISIIGTSGIVEPMSMKAYADSVRLQIRQAAAMGTSVTESSAEKAMTDNTPGSFAAEAMTDNAQESSAAKAVTSGQERKEDRYQSICNNKTILLTPGNYGLFFLRQCGYDLPKAPVVVCSNFIGEALDEASACGYDNILLVGHIGKLVKLAAGIMNTHSSMADGRNEIFTAHAALAGAGGDVLKKLMEAATTDACIAILKEEGIEEKVLASILEKAQSHLDRRCARVRSGMIVFSNVYGELGKTGWAADQICRRQTQNQADRGHYT